MMPTSTTDVIRAPFAALPLAVFFSVCLLLAGLCTPMHAWSAKQNVYDKVNEAVKAQSEGNTGHAFQLYNDIINSGDLNSDPNILAYIYNNRAVIQLSRGNEGMAFADFEKALELRPDPTAYYNRALLLSERGRQQEALADLDKAIELHPKYSKAFEQRGYLRLDMGDSKGGRSDLRMAEALRMKIEFLDLLDAVRITGKSAPGGQPGRESMRVE